MSIISKVASSALCNISTLHATQVLADDVLLRGVEGDFVECGVFAGANAAIMADAIRGTERKLHLFDSFLGIPEPKAEDGDFLAAGHKAGLSAYSLDNFKSNMRGWGIPEERLAYHVGWFRDTVPLWANTRPKIALLRLDGDLYRSTKVCIDLLYPFLSTGGWCIVDDFALDGCRKAVDEHFGKLYPPAYFQKP